MTWHASRGRVPDQEAKKVWLGEAPLIGLPPQQLHSHHATGHLAMERIESDLRIVPDVRVTKSGYSSDNDQKWWGGMFSKQVWVTRMSGCASQSWDHVSLSKARIGGSYPTYFGLRLNLWIWDPQTTTSSKCKTQVLVSQWSEKILLDPSRSLRKKMWSGSELRHA